MIGHRRGDQLVPARLEQIGAHELTRLSAVVIGKHAARDRCVRRLDDAEQEIDR